MWLLRKIIEKVYFSCSCLVIFKVYDSDSNGKVTFKEIIEVLQDLSGAFISDKQQEVIILCNILQRRITVVKYFCDGCFVK